MFKKDQFIKWMGEDDDGRFTYTGQFKMMNGDTVIFENEEGLMLGVHKDDGTFESIKRPDGWNRPKSTVTTIEAPKKTKKPRDQSGAPTKLEQVVALLRANPALINDRKTAIKKIVADVGMSEAGASTYFSNAKKKLT